MGFGGWLPWVYTEAGPVIIGAVGGGLWVFYAGLIVLAGGMLPPRLRMAAVVQGVLGGLVGIGIPVWQVLHLWGLVRMEGWAPAPGLVLSAFGGVLALVAAAQLARLGQPEVAPV